MWEQIWKDQLKVVSEHGHIVTRKRGDFKELVAHKFAIDDPRNRLIGDRTRNMNIFQCIGQFLWITQGNFNVTDIEYYQPDARKLSSNGITMIGAYGLRLFGIHHLNQMKYLLELLSEGKHKRKAVASVYLPQFDQHNKENEEVPCTLNLQYLIRDDKVNAITYMRSQDAYKILPYDLFVFTMLQEYVTASLSNQYEVELGTYNHFSGSFHTYEKHEREICDVFSNSVGSCSSMNNMPTEDVEINLIKINRFEIALRKAVDFHKENQLDLDGYARELENYANQEYWRQIGMILLCYGAWKIKNHKKCEEFTNMLDPVYRQHVERFFDTHPMDKS